MNDGWLEIEVWLFLQVCIIIHPTQLCIHLICLSVFAFPHSNTAENKRSRLWLPARPETLTNHLLICPYQSPEVKSRAQAKKSKGGDSTLSPARAVSTVSQLHPQDPSISNHLRDPSFQAIQPIFGSLPPQNPSSGQGPVLHTNTSVAWLSAMSPVAGMSSIPNSPALTPSELSISPSESASQVGRLSRQPSFSSDRQSKRPRRSRAPTTSLPQWADGHQVLFETQLARITAACGFPLSWVDNPEFEKFCQEFIPGARVPSRGTLTRQIVPDTLQRLQNVTRGSLASRPGLSGTLQADGWTGINFVHLIAFMLSAGGQVSIQYFL